MKAKTCLLNGYYKQVFFYNLSLAKYSSYLILSYLISKQHYVKFQMYFQYKNRGHIDYPTFIKGNRVLLSLY